MFHIENGCHFSKNGNLTLTRAEFSNTLSDQRCRTCERMTYGEVGERAAAVSRGELIEAREGETMRLTRDGAEVFRPDKPNRLAEMRDIALFPILQGILDATGPADLLLTLAEVMRHREQHQPGRHDRKFWCIARRATQAAAAIIKTAADNPEEN